MANIFHLQQGSTSDAIEGNEGVYIVQVNSKTEAVQANDLTEKTKEATETLRGIIDQWYYYSLYKSYGAKDNRLKRNIIQ